jgi:cardiolipin synthase A/B
VRRVDPRPRSALAGWLAASALCVAAVGCIAPPPREQVLAAEREFAPTPAPEPRRDAALDRVAPTKRQRDFVRRVDEIETAITRRPLVAGNQVTLLVDGPATHAAQLAAIARARHHIHLVTYLLADDAVGRKYRDALIERARAGVRVRFMYDGFGGAAVGPGFRAALERAGVEVHEYGSINPFAQPEVWRISQRNHRKLLIVDGRVAFTGGINIDDSYSSSASSGSAEHGWRDTQIRIEGPAAAEFQRLFFADWEREVGPIRDDARYWPVLRARGVEWVRAVAKEGADVSDQLRSRIARFWQAHFDRKRYAIYASYLAAISESQSRVWITQAYFAPNEEFREALANAARRGCDVRLLVPANSDIGLVYHASRHEYASLLEAGVRIFEYEGTVLHAKTAVVDGVWSTVGSSNLDYQSFVHNDEANATIIGHAFAREMERMFESDLANAREVTLDAWRERPIRERVLQTLANSLKYWI